VAESGTVEEIDQFVAAGKPAMLYFSNRPIDPSKIDQDQQARLRKFQQTTYQNALVGKFSDLGELRRILLRDLMQQVRSLKSKGDIRREEDAKARDTRSEALESARRVLGNHLHAFSTPKVCVSLGPKLAYRKVAAREELFSFIKLTASQNQIATSEQKYDPDVQMNALLRPVTVQRYQGGVYCFEESRERDPWSRPDPRMSTAKFISFDEHGFVTSQIALCKRTYYTKIYPGGGPGGETNSYYFWDLVLYLRHILSWAARFYQTFPPQTDLVLKVSLEELQAQPLKLTSKIEAPHQVGLAEATAEDLDCPSTSLDEHARSLIIEACYQLLWNVGGGEPPERNQVEQSVSHLWDGRE
jgi:hypothetical protein